MKKSVSRRICSETSEERAKAKISIVLSVRRKGIRTVGNEACRVLKEGLHHPHHEPVRRQVGLNLQRDLGLLDLDRYLGTVLQTSPVNLRYRCARERGTFEVDEDVVRVRAVEGASEDR